MPDLPILKILQISYWRKTNGIKKQNPSIMAGINTLDWVSEEKRYKK